VVPGTEKIMKLNPSGQLKTWAEGLTTVLGLVFDQHDRMYVLESMTNPGLPPQEAGSGKVLRIDPNGTQTEIATGLNFPGGMTLGPDGNLYVSNNSFASPQGAGQIVKIEIASGKPGKNQVHTTAASVTAPQTETLSGGTSESPAPVSQHSVFVGSQTVHQGAMGSEQRDSDFEVERIASKRLSEDSELGSVTVTVIEGRALLMGTVYSAASRAKAEKVLKAVAGIRSINNQIYVSGP